MAKKKPPKPGFSGFDFVRVTVDCDHARIDYHVTGLKVNGRDTIEDENVGEWTEDEIRDVAGSMIGVKDADRKLIEVDYA